MTHPFPEHIGAIPSFFDDIDTLPALFARRAERTPSAPAFLVQRGDSVWNPINWEMLQQDVVALSEGFAGVGIGTGKRVGILARTSVEWEIAQRAILRCGGIVAGIDPYYPDELVDSLVAQLELTALLVEDEATLLRIPESTRRRLAFIAFLKETRSPTNPDIPTLQNLCATRQQRVMILRPMPSANTPALIAFSSGSTGQPKPIVYTHAQVVHACRSILDVYPELSDSTRLVCWLPLANLFQRIINFCATAKGASSFIVADPRRVMEVLPIAKPEVFMAVPRFCERVHEAMMQRIAKRPGVRRMVEAAIALAAEVRDADSKRRPIAPVKRIAFGLADRFVLARLRAVFGGNLRFIVSGSAPMPHWLLDRFDAIGIPVLEAYGVSENIVPIAANRLGDRRPGTVGKPVGDNQVRIARDGQVEVRGRGNFDPSQEENAARAADIDNDGYLATGDVGSFDSDGYLVLQGRRAEAYKNAQGRWISLPLVEAALRRVEPIEYAAVIRLPDERLVAVLALMSGMPMEPAPGPVAVESSMGHALRTGLERELVKLPIAMRPIAFVVVCRGFSPATGELTTNLKLRRGAIAERVAGHIDELRFLRDAQSDTARRAILLRFI